MSDDDTEGKPTQTESTIVCSSSVSWTGMMSKDHIAVNSWTSQLTNNCAVAWTGETRAGEITIGSWTSEMSTAQIAVRRAIGAGILSGDKLTTILGEAAANAAGVADATAALAQAADAAATLALLKSAAEPPQLADFCLSLCLSGAKAEAVIGDLNEKFHRDCDHFGAERARRMYWGRTLRSLGPLLLRIGSRVIRWGLVIESVRRFFSGLTLCSQPPHRSTSTRWLLSGADRPLLKIIQIRLGTGGPEFKSRRSDQKSLPAFAIGKFLPGKQRAGCGEETPAFPADATPPRERI